MYTWSIFLLMGNQCQGYGKRHASKQSQEKSTAFLSTLNLLIRSRSKYVFLPQSYTYNPSVLAFAIGGDWAGWIMSCLGNDTSVVLWGRAQNGLGLWAYYR
eukprot:g1901.t1